MQLPPERSVRKPEKAEEASRKEWAYRKIGIVLIN